MVRTCQDALRDALVRHRAAVAQQPQAQALSAAAVAIKHAFDEHRTFRDVTNYPTLSLGQKAPKAVAAADQAPSQVKIQLGSLGDSVDLLRKRIKSQQLQVKHHRNERQWLAEMVAELAMGVNSAVYGRALQSKERKKETENIRLLLASLLGGGDGGGDGDDDNAALEDRVAAYYKDYNGEVPHHDACVVWSRWLQILGSSSSSSQCLCCVPSMPCRSNDNDGWSSKRACGHHPVRSSASPPLPRPHAGCNGGACSVIFDV